MNKLLEIFISNQKELMTWLGFMLVVVIKGTLLYLMLLLVLSAYGIDCISWWRVVLVYVLYRYFRSKEVVKVGKYN